MAETYMKLFKETIFQISGPDGEWYTLPIPMEVKPSENVLDTTNSGRDNNTALMFRDVIGRKSKYTFKMPEGMNSLEGAKIFPIIMGEYFICNVPDIFTGQWENKKFYNVSCAPEIEKITPQGWTYKEWTFTATEM